MASIPQPIAKGIRTDHPIPDLPFVDDSHIPIHNAAAVEAVGRKAESGMWGRTDRCPDDSGWIAFTTDPLRRDLAWLVRWHPQHGRTVAVYHDSEVTEIYTLLTSRAVLMRHGGYWWDGERWYRPSLVWDRAAEQYADRPVPDGTAVSTEQVLASSAANADAAALLSIIDLDVDKPLTGRWPDHLALWAQRRVAAPVEQAADQVPLSRSVVRLSAPELAVDELIGTNDLAELAGIAASTLRAYVARGEGDIPTPQARISGRPVWSRAVAADWLEARSRGDIASAVHRRGDDYNQPPGVMDLWERFTHAFTTRMWSNPSTRKRFALRWRNKAGVQDLAHTLAWLVAADLRNIVPLADLRRVIQLAILQEFRDDIERDRKRAADDQERARAEGRQPRYAPDGTPQVALGTPVARALDWLIRHAPDTAAATIADVVHESRDLGLTPDDVQDAIETALTMDGELQPEARTKFLNRLFVN